MLPAQDKLSMTWRQQVPQHKVCAPGLARTAPRSSARWRVPSPSSM
jgi:hypothetical protein